MRENYQKQVSLLLDVLPIVAKADVFALKGGTAINFFVLDCPRLSVDIDLHYLPLKNRAESLRDIQEHMQWLKAEIEKSLPDTRVDINLGNNSAQVQNRYARVAIEPNQVIRGPLLPAVTRRLCPKLEKEFGRSLTITCLAEEELYAGKFCAALDRQHPRDLFDVKLFLELNTTLSKVLMDTFTVYLTCQDKQIHERLNPNRKNITDLFESNFRGMTVDDISLKELEAIQEQFPALLLGNLEEVHREFLVGFKRGAPDWTLLPFPHASELPAVRWKQQNLEGMNGSNRERAIEKLIAVFNASPPHQKFKQGAIMSEPSAAQNSQEALTEDIIQELISSNLITKTKQNELKQKIAAGTLTSEDWSLLIDMAAEQGETND